MKTFFGFTLVTIFTMAICACGVPIREVKNWNDPRCYTYTDAWNKRGNSNISASMFAFLGGNMREAVNLSSYAPSHWVEGYSGDSRKIMVGYTDNQEIVGYKDVNGNDLTVADLTKIGPVITKYSNLAQIDPIYRKKAQDAKLFPELYPDAGKPYSASPLPSICQ